MPTTLKRLTAILADDFIRVLCIFRFLARAEEIENGSSARLRSQGNCGIALEELIGENVRHHGYRSMASRLDLKPQRHGSAANLDSRTCFVIETIAGKAGECTEELDQHRPQEVHFFRVFRDIEN